MARNFLRQIGKTTKKKRKDKKITLKKKKEKKKGKIKKQISKYTYTQGQ